MAGMKAQRRLAAYTTKLSARDELIRRLKGPINSMGLSNGMASTKQTLAQRRALRWAQGSICAGCGQHLPSARRLPLHHRNYPTFDHVTPQSVGGRRLLTNGLLKHQRCNQERANSPPNGCDLLWVTVVSVRLSGRPKSLKSLFKGGRRNPLAR
jgi:hypothetical protein